MDRKVVIGLVYFLLLSCFHQLSFATVRQYAAQVVDGDNAPENTHFYQTKFHVVNLSADETAEMTFQLYTNAGEFFDERAIELGPGEKIAQFLKEGDLFTDLEQFEGSVEIAGTEELASVVIRVDGVHWSNFRLFPGRLANSGEYGRLPACNFRRKRHGSSRSSRGARRQG